MKVKNNDDIVQAFRQKMINPETGKTVPLDKKYLNKEIWVQITDPILFKKIFPNYVHHISEELDEWWVFVKKTNPLLNKVDDLIELKEELIKNYESDFEKLAFRKGVTFDALTKMNYYQVKDFLIKNNIIKPEPEIIPDENEVKKIPQTKQNQPKSTKKNTKQTENDIEESQE